MKESLFSVVKRELEDAKKLEETVGKNDSFSIKLMFKDWCRYNTDDTKQLILAAARSIGIDEEKIKLSHEWLSSFCEVHGFSKDEVIFIKITVKL